MPDSCRHGRETVLARARGSSAEWWQVADVTEPAAAVRGVDIQLEIEATAGSGYLLLMDPEGCFKTDQRYRSREQALEAARQQFGAPIDGWVPS